MCWIYRRKTLSINELGCSNGGTLTFFYNSGENKMDKKTIDAKLLGILAELDELRWIAAGNCAGKDTQRINQTFLTAYEAVQKAYMLE